MKNIKAPYYLYFRSTYDNSWKGPISLTSLDEDKIQRYIDKYRDGHDKYMIKECSIELGDHIVMSEEIEQKVKKRKKI